MNRRFSEGIFLGIDRRTGQYMLYANDEVKFARTIVRVPEREKWSKELLSAVKLTPRSLHQPRDSEIVFREKVDEEGKLFDDRVVVARQLQLRASDFAEHGLTRGCPKCNQLLKKNDWKKTSGPHSAQCRTRIEGELAKTVSGQMRLAAATGRLDRTVDDLGQKHRDDLPQGEIVGDMGQGSRAALEPPTNPEFIPMDAPPMDVAERIQRQEDFAESMRQHEASSSLAGGLLPPAAGAGIAVSLRHESREAPPSPDEAGGAETRGGDFGEAGGPTPLTTHEDSMDINAVDHNPETDLSELMRAMSQSEKDELVEDNREILAVIASLGGSKGKYRRERMRGLKAIVSEIYSPPRVTAATKLLPELRLIPGFALDLTTADTDGALWDFDSKVMRDRALNKVREQRPMLLIGSPMCTAFSTWQRVNNKIRDPVTVAAERKRAVEHVEFCVELYREQLRHGR